MTQAFLFFSFQLALPKTSVLLLCQHNSRFLTFFILLFSFAVCYLWHIALCSLEVCPLFSYSLLFHSLSFWGSLRSFAMPVCFNSDFLTFFILFFALCLLPFTFVANCSLSFGILPVVFLFSVVSFAVFLGQSSLFAMSVCFNSRFLTFFILFFCPFALSFAFEAFCALPFGISPVVFLFSVVSFAVFWGQYSLFFNVCLFQQRFSYLFYIVFCPFAFFPLLFGHFALCPFQFYKQPFALYFPLLLFSFFFVCGIHLLRYF